MRSESGGSPAPGTEYTLEMYAVWRGPSVDGKGYYLTKACRISRGPGTRVTVNEQPTTTTSGLATVECDEVRGPFTGQPNLPKTQNEPFSNPRNTEGYGGNRGNGQNGGSKTGEGNRELAKTDNGDEYYDESVFISAGWSRTA